MDQKLEMLAKVPLLAHLQKRDLEQVGRVCDEVDLPAGRVVTKQGATAEEFFVIVDGAVTVERDGKHLRDFLRDRGEQLLRRRPARHQGRDPSQRRLLLGQPGELGAALRVHDRGGDELGEIGETRSGVRGERLVGLLRVDEQCPPQPPLSDDRAGD